MPFDRQSLICRLADLTPAEREAEYAEIVAEPWPSPEQRAEENARLAAECAADERAEAAEMRAIYQSLTPAEREEIDTDPELRALYHGGA